MSHRRWSAVTLRAGVLKLLASHEASGGVAQCCRSLTRRVAARITPGPRRMVGGPLIGEMPSAATYGATVARTRPCSSVGSSASASHCAGCPLARHEDITGELPSRSGAEASWRIEGSAGPRNRNHRLDRR